MVVGGRNNVTPATEYQACSIADPPISRLHSSIQHAFSGFEYNDIVSNMPGQPRCRFELVKMPAIHIVSHHFLPPFRFFGVDGVLVEAATGA